uniref:RING-type domain-containing protein n=1 Tax=Plectus sambesii TaxID=2011161 RepID=A0A914XDX5_9BILA
MRACPKCKTNEYNNRSFVLMINECGHSLCKNCVENLFVRNSGPCPTCGRTLKKNDFWRQMFDDPLIEKENHFRKKLRQVYNLREDDFPSLREYNDYLERFEQLVWNLANDENVEETQLEVKRFASERLDVIERNRKRLGPDEIWVQSCLDDERRFRERLTMDIESQELTNASGPGAKGADARAIIEELKTSDLPAEVILDRQRKRQIEANLLEKEQEAKRKKTRVHDKKHQEVTTFGPLRKSGQPFVYHPVDLVLNGPALPEMFDLEACGYLRHMRPSTTAQVAGGFPTETGCYRALVESRSDLLVF